MVSPHGAALCLSGGGWRAAYFHLGVIKHLRSRGCLGHVKQVVGVSGGAVVAALLWKHASLSSEDAIRRVEEDLNRINSFGVRQVGLAWLPLRTWILRRLLQGIFKTTGDRPFEASLVSCDLRRCAPVYFDLKSDGSVEARWHGGGDGRPDAWVSARVSKSFDVASACVCSAAFPLFYAAQPFTKEHLTVAAGDSAAGPNRLGSMAVGAFPDRSLTDGGVFDNLGLTAVSNPSLDLWVSDASGPLDQVDALFGTALSSVSRTVDLLMAQRADAAIQSNGHAKHFRLASPLGRPAGDGAEIIALASRLRTDLDFFNDDERRALVYAGERQAARYAGGAPSPPTVSLDALKNGAQRKLLGPRGLIALLIPAAAFIASGLLVHKATRSFCTATMDSGLDSGLDSGSESGSESGFDSGPDSGSARQCTGSSKIQVGIADYGASGDSAALTKSFQTGLGSGFEVIAPSTYSGQLERVNRCSVKVAFLSPVVALARKYRSPDSQLTIPIGRKNIQSSLSYPVELGWTKGCGVSGPLSRPDASYFVGDSYSASTHRLPLVYLKLAGKDAWTQLDGRAEIRKIVGESAFGECKASFFTPEDLKDPLLSDLRHQSLPWNIPSDLVVANREWWSELSEAERSTVKQRLEASGLFLPCADDASNCEGPFAQFAEVVGAIVVTLPKGIFADATFDAPPDEFDFFKFRSRGSTNVEMRDDKKATIGHGTVVYSGGKFTMASKDAKITPVKGAPPDRFLLVPEKR